jgi:predicted nucleic acid-binding protein
VKYLLDTNVISEVMKHVPNPQVIGWLSQVEEDELFLSVVSIAEIERGIALMKDGPRRSRLESWAANELPLRFDRRVLAVDLAIARLWGQLTAEAGKRGQPLEAMDGALAATAVLFNLTLVTRNTRDFHGLGVRLLDPWESRG